MNRESAFDQQYFERYHERGFVKVGRGRCYALESREGREGVAA